MTTTGIILTIIGICSSIYYGQHNKQVSERNRVDSQYETIKVTLREQEAFIKTYYSTISENRTRLKQKFEENFCSKFLDSCKFHLNKCHHVLDLNGQFKNTEACELITKFDLATPLEYQLVPDAGDETFNSLMAPLVTLKHSIKRFKEVHLEFKKNRELHFFP